MKYLILFYIFKLIFSSSINCDINQDCSTCQKLWEEENKNYCSFSFYNAFCYNSTKKGYSYNSSFLFKYDNNKCISGQNLDNICGNRNISAEINTKDFINFFSFYNPEYLEKNNLLCQYIFTNNDKNSKEDLVFEIEANINKQNIQQTENNKNLIIIFVQEFDTLTKTLYEINLNEFKDNKYNIKIANYKYVSLYISLIQKNNYINTNEIISIDIGAKKDNSKALKDSKYKYSLILVCIFFILCVISCFILYLIKYKRNRELIRLRAINMANNLNQFGLENRIDPEVKKNKLNDLFKTKLKKIKYLKKLNVNETTACSICLEEFIENKSLVCITPCLHIFHYDCLYNWLFSENSNCQCPYCNYDLLSNKEPTKRHKTQEINNNNVKENKYLNKNNKRENIPKTENNNNVNSSSERVIKKIKKNKENKENNNNDINNINKNDNIINNNKNNNIENNLENKKENEKDKSANNENEDNDISFENDYDRIKNNKKIIKNIKENNEIKNTENNKDEIEINIDDEENKNNINKTDE